jgi:hypothetical protein
VTALPDTIATGDSWPAYALQMNPGFGHLLISFAQIGADIAATGTNIRTNTATASGQFNLFLVHGSIDRRLFANLPVGPAQYGAAVDTKSQPIFGGLYEAERAFEQQAADCIEKARLAALNNDLRLAYHWVYRGLDQLFLIARWGEVGLVLREICSPRYPAAFGIGAMRFSSDAANRIPGWSEILEELVNTARRQGVDTKKAMRGLVKLDGTI